VVEAAINGDEAADARHDHQRAQSEEYEDQKYTLVNG